MRVAVETHADTRRIDSTQPDLNHIIPAKLGAKGVGNAPPRMLPVHDFRPVKNMVLAPMVAQPKTLTF